MVEEIVIINGIRGEQFRELVYSILKMGHLDEKYITLLLDDISMKLYEQVFTHSSADSEKNYEWLEFLGDTTLNKSVAWYLAIRFPQLCCSSGVKVLTRLKINLISKKTFSYFAKQLQFWEYITASEQVRNYNMNKTLEDVFEAFFGATELLIDTRLRAGCGNHICFEIISKLLDKLQLSLDYNELFDAKTRLKETIDYYGSEMGIISYNTFKIDNIHYVECIHQFNGTSKTISKGYGYLKANAQEKASKEALEVLKGLGFEKPLPDEYKKFVLKR